MDAGAEGLAPESAETRLSPRSKCPSLPSSIGGRAHGPECGARGKDTAGTGEVENSPAGAQEGKIGLPHDPAIPLPACAPKN